MQEKKERRQKSKTAKTNSDAARDNATLGNRVNHPVFPREILGNLVQMRWQSGAFMSLPLLFPPPFFPYQNVDVSSARITKLLLPQFAKSQDPCFNFLRAFIQLWRMRYSRRNNAGLGKKLDHFSRTICKCEFTNSRSNRPIFWKFKCEFTRKLKCEFTIEFKCEFTRKFKC